MSNFVTVSGFNEEVDGTYVYIGQHNGHPAYQKDDFHYLMYEETWMPWSYYIGYYLVTAYVLEGSLPILVPKYKKISENPFDPSVPWTGMLPSTSGETQTGSAIPDSSSSESSSSYDPSSDSSSSSELSSSSSSSESSSSSSSSSSESSSSSSSSSDSSSSSSSSELSSSSSSSESSSSSSSSLDFSSLSSSSSSSMNDSPRALYWATNNHDETKYCSLGTAPQLNVNGFTTLSVAGWFDSPANWTGKPYMTYISKDESWKLWNNPTFGEIGIVIGSWATGYWALFRSSLVPTNQWNHIAFVYDGSAGRLDVYLNNVKQARGVPTFWESTTLPASISDTDAMSTRVGGNYSGDGNMVNPNKADEIAIWSRALSDLEISTLWNSGSGIKGDISQSPWNSGLMGMWHFDEGRGVTVYDSSGNNINGTLQTGVTWTSGKVGV